MKVFLRKTSRYLSMDTVETNPIGYADMISAAIKIAPLAEKENLQLTLNEMLKNPAYNPKHHVPISAKARIALGKVKRLLDLEPRPELSSPIDQIPSFNLCRDDFKVPDLVKDYREEKER